jgi:hypothetical protein
MADINIATDKADYQPGEVVYITVSDIKPGGTAYFTLAHLTDAGADGVSGTKDDVVAYDLTGTGSWTVVDGGAGDLDGLANGVIVTSWQVNDDAANEQFYLSAERVLPNGKLGEPAITSFTDVPQPSQRGSIAWEKRDETGALQGGAAFEISPDPSDGVGVMTVVDNGANDADPDAGQILVQNVLPGTYTITETVAPAGYALDDDPTRVVTVSSGEAEVVGTQGTDNTGNTDESDFHNIRLPPDLGSIAWEKRDETGALQGGAEFEISPDPSDGAGVMTVVDNGANDADPDAGQILVQNVLPGTYTITETVAPAGYAVDDDPTRVVTVSSGEAEVVGTQGTDNTGNTDESDFHNIPCDNFPAVASTSHITLYFADDEVTDDIRPQPNGDGLFTVKIDDVPASAPDDLDEWLDDVLNFLIAQGDIASDTELLGVAIKGGKFEVFYADDCEPTPETPPSGTFVQGPGVDLTYDYDLIF